MKIAMLITFIVILLFDIYMVTPFGVFWTLKNLDEGKPCYGLLIMFVTAIPLMFIACGLGIIN